MPADFLQRDLRLDSFVGNPEYYRFKEFEAACKYAERLKENVSVMVDPTVEVGEFVTKYHVIRQWDVERRIKEHGWVEVLQQVMEPRRTLMNQEYIPKKPIKRKEGA